jgi:glycolate oxidase iron-sulfur subunit
MQTQFSLAQLADPNIEEANKILRACVHCGFCTATCPTYVLLGDELDSPRGRIYLIKEMLENDRSADEKTVKHIDRCLSCLSCMTTCPSGVHYMHLVDQARAHIEETYTRPIVDRIYRATLAKVLPYPNRLRLALALAQVAKPFAWLFASLGMTPIVAMLKLAPPRVPLTTIPRSKHVFAANGQRKGRVALLSGCVDKVVRPSIRESAIRLLNRSGIEVVLPVGEGCCGSLPHHMGREDEALNFARNNIDTFIRELESGGLDALLVTASGCGTTIKDYGFMFRNDDVYKEKAEKISSLAMDISEYLAKIEIAPPAKSIQITVAYHSACSMQHGQKISRQPRELLKNAGFLVRDIGEGHLCCGSAGTYNLLQPEIAERLLSRKIENIEKLKPQIVATGNIGCITQIAGATKIPVLHTVELLDWAAGGPIPAQLERCPEILVGLERFEKVKAASI